MSLYAKVVLLLCALFATYGAVDYVVQREVILPSFETLESDLARTDMDRVHRAIDRELEQLQTFCADWGNWLETYQYMAGQNPEFIENNMTPVTLEDAGLDVVAFLDNDARFVWRKGLDPVTHEELAYSMLDGEGLGVTHPFFDAVRKGETAKGLIVTEHGPAMIVVAPVLDGAGQGPHRGAVLLARVISSDVAARIAEQAQVKLQVFTPPPATSSATHAGTPTAPRVVTHDLTNLVFLDLKDIFGKPSIMLRIDVPRIVSAQGRDAIGYALLSLFIAGVIVLVVMLLALRHMVLRPVSRMTRHAVQIGEGDDLSKRMNVSRGDEIGVLAREFDRMVDKLADARRRLVDQSFEAGAAQVSAGVLHNIGNAMTPLSVSVATLQERLQTAPAGEIEMVIAEIEAGSSDPARHADLEQFLRLASRELAAVVERAGDDAAAVARQAQSIQAALVQQAQSSRRGPLIEPASLTALIDQGVEMVAPQLRQRLSIEMEDSVHAAGTLPLPRVTLQQVVQNIVQNAAEAVNGSGRGRLRISCDTGADAEHGDVLILRFEDDGVGIAPEHLARIFEKGFSTKSRDKNHGIGLHWCANALNTLGGRVRVERGNDCGATFIVTLPLRRSAAAEAA